MPKNAPVQVLRRSTRINKGSPLPKSVSDITDKSTGAEKVLRGRRLSLDQTLKEEKRDEEEPSEPFRRITRRHSISSIDSDASTSLQEEKKVTRPVRRSSKSPTKKNKLSNLESIVENIKEEVNENECPKTPRRKSKMSLKDLSMIKEENVEENKEIVESTKEVKTRTSPRKDSLRSNHSTDLENIPMDIDDTITKTTPSKSPSTKSPVVLLNSSIVDKHTSSSEKKVKSTSVSPARKVSPEKNCLNTTRTPINNVTKQLFKENESEIGKKIDDLLQGVLEESSCDEEKDIKPKHELLDDMAEEGEEDTPSEGSNDIIERGEDLNSTDSFVNDVSYESDSFIDKDETIEALLSGEEYDLSYEELKKQKESVKKSKSRIIGLSSDEDDDDEPNKIIKIERKKKPAKTNAKRKSRIIQQPDSSEDDPDSEEEVRKAKVSKPKKNKQEPVVESLDEKTANESVIKIEQTETTQKCKSIIILENIKLDNVSPKRLSDRIQQVVKDVHSTIPDKGEISLNVTLDYWGANSSADENNQNIVNLLDSNENEAEIKKAVEKETHIETGESLVDMGVQIVSIDLNTNHEEEESGNGNDILVDNLNGEKTKKKRKRIKKHKVGITKMPQQNNVANNVVNGDDKIDEKKMKRKKSKKRQQTNEDMDDDVVGTTKMPQQNNVANNVVNGDDKIDEKKNKRKKSKKRKQTNEDRDDDVVGTTKMPQQNNVANNVVNGDDKIDEKKNKRKKSKKRQQTNEDRDDDVVIAKKQKLDIFSNYIFPKPKSVVEDAVSSQKRSVELPQFTMQTSWITKKVKEISPTKPSSESVVSKPTDKLKQQIYEKLQSKKDNIKMKNKNNTLNKIQSKFHIKDFKNAMIYDVHRNRRMETKDLLRKKGAFV